MWKILNENREDMCHSSLTYRVQWRLYSELVDIFESEPGFCQEFQSYLESWNEECEKQYLYYYRWGFEMGQAKIGTEHIRQRMSKEKKNLRLCKEKIRMRKVAEQQSREMQELWSMFCEAEKQCHTYQAMYLCMLGVEDGEKYNNKTGIPPN